MEFPEDLLYSPDHEWARVSGNRVMIGITDHAQDALGDIVFVDVPAVGTAVDANEKISEVESTKSVSDIFTPVSGTIVEVNDALGTSAQLLNTDPYGEGWICVVELGEPTELDALLDATAYRGLVEG